MTSRKPAISMHSVTTLKKGAQGRKPDPKIVAANKRVMSEFKPTSRKGWN